MLPKLVMIICVIVGSIDAQHIALLKGPCNFLNTINITDGHGDGDGNFIHKNDVYKQGTFGEYNYIIVNHSETVMVEPHMRGCVCLLKPCINVCCLEDENNSKKNSACVKTDTLMVFDKELIEAEIDLSGNEFGVLNNGRPCDKMYKLEPLDYPQEDQWWFLRNGSIQLVNGNMVKPKDYCFGQQRNETFDEITTEVLLCYFEDVDVRLSLYPIGMIFSIPFLVITFFVYGFIPELRNLHGKCLMCYVFSLTVLYISLSVVQLEGDLIIVESSLCIFSGFTIYFSVLLCFFWLNVMCYDIWSTFKGIRGRGGDRKRFIFYCLYAFGVPVMLTSIAWVVDMTKILPEGFQPMIGMKRCWMQDNRLVELLYVYTPISTILVINITLYSITAYRIYQVQKETSVIRKGESQKHSKGDSDKDRFFLYLRLFIVMGATWSMESISWAFKSSLFFYVSDVLNCLQGFIIFILFVWKPKVKKLITKRYRSIRKLPPISSSQMHSAGSTRTTETSRISSGIHNGHKGQTEKLMLNDP